MGYGITAIIPATDPAEDGEEEFFDHARRGSRSGKTTCAKKETPSDAPTSKDTALLAINYNNHVVSSLIAMLQGVEVFCSLAIMYLYKDDFGLHPATLGLIMAGVRLPWALKPAWALLSDSRPIFGRRRKPYVIIGALLCCASTLGMGTVGQTSVYTATFLLLIYFLGAAICNVIGEALVVEAGRADGNGPAESVSTFFAFRKLSFAVMSYFSGLLLNYMEKQHLFLVATILPVVVLIAAFFLKETPCHYTPSVYSQVQRLREVIERPVLTNSTLFIFLTMVTPSAGAAMFYFMTNNLSFGPELLGRMALCQSIASLGGILTYRTFFSQTSIRKLLLYSTLLVTPFCFLPVVVVQRWNIALGIPDTYFVVTDNVLLEFLGEFQAMPILVLAARLCPPGLESTIYSFLLSGYNLGLALGSILSAGLTSTLGVTAETFSRLSALIIICSLTNYLPLMVIGLVPDCDLLNEERSSSELLRSGESTSSKRIKADGLPYGMCDPASFRSSSSMTTASDEGSPTPSGAGFPGEDVVSIYSDTSSEVRAPKRSNQRGCVRSDTGGEV